MFSKCVSKCFQIVCFKPFSNYIFQSVFFFSKFIIGFKVVFKLCVSMVFKIAKLLKVFTNYMWGILKTLWDTQFENHWNLWGILKILWNTFWKDTIWNPLRPMGEFWKHFETHNFENTLKTHHLKTLWNTLFENHLNLWEIFENTLKHIIWKPLKPMGDFWKHFETYHLKTLWNTQFENPLKHLGDFWKPYWYPTELSPLRRDHWNLMFSIGTQMKHMRVCSHAWKENLLFSRCWKYRLHNYRVKQ